MQETFDVVVVGGGPAGSATANLAARLGHRVVLVEQERFPRFHIGESLLPGSLPVLQRLGVVATLDSQYLRKYGARFCDSATGQIASYRFAEALDPLPYAYQVPRDRFDTLLLDAARAAGVDVREGWHVGQVRFEHGRATGVDVRDPEGRARRIDASVVVDASGRATLIARRARSRSPIKLLDRHGFFAHWEGVWRDQGEAAGDIQIVIFDHGWFWFIPFAGARTSVGFVSSSEHARSKTSGETLEEFFSRTVQLSPFATEWLRTAHRVSSVRAVADFSYRVASLAGPGWLLVGDAAGFIDPLFSTGVHFALKGAELAVDAVDQMLVGGEGRVPATERYESALRSAAELCTGVVQSFYQGEFRQTLFASDQRPILRRIITSLLAGDVFGAGSSWSAFVTEKYPAR